MIADAKNLATIKKITEKTKTSKDSRILVDKGRSDELNKKNITPHIKPATILYISTSSKLS